MRSAYLFFTLMATFAIPGRFISLFFQAHGLSPSQIGIILSISGLFALPVTPIICHLADNSKNRERVLLTIQVLQTFSFLLNCIAYPPLHLLPANLRFVFILICYSLSSIFQNPTFPIVSAISISQLRESHMDASIWFGKERLWAAVGWAATSLMLGCVLDWLPFGFGFVYVFAIFSSAIFIFTIICFQKANRLNHFSSLHLFPNMNDEISSLTSTTAIPSPASSPRSLFRAIYPVLTSGGYITVLYYHLVFWLAVGMSTVEYLLFLYFVNDLKASNFLCGITVVVTVMIEIPLFAYAPRILSRLGESNVTIIGAFAFIIRMVGYCVIPSAWFVLFLEPLHGVTIATVECASVSFVSKRTCPEYEATAQAILAFIHGVGFSVGGAGGGFIMETFGSRVMYLTAGSMVFLATCLFMVGIELHTEHDGNQRIVREISSGVI